MSSLIAETPVDNCDFCNEPADDYLKHLLENHNFSIDKARLVIQAMTNGQDHKVERRQQQGNKENREELLVNGVPIAVPKSAGIIIINAGGGDGVGSGDGRRVSSSAASSLALKKVLNSSSKSLSRRTSSRAEEPQSDTVDAPNRGNGQDQDTGCVEDAFEAWRAGRCQYRCPRQSCSKEFTESSFFWRHVRLIHDTPRELFKAENQEDSYIMAREFLDCRLCRQKVLHDRAELDNHFLTQHPNTSLESFFLSYVSNTTSAASPVDAAANGADNQDNNDDDDDILFLCEVPAKEPQNEPLVRVKQEGVRRSAKRSRPTFQKVTATTTTTNTGTGRVKMPRLAGNKKGNDVGESDLQKIMKWDMYHKLMRSEKKCQICSKSFAVRNRVSLDTHIVEVHEINLVQYINLYLEGKAWNQGCLYRCHYCKDEMYITTSHQQLGTHIATKHQSKSQLEHSRDFGLRYVESLAKCPFCKTSILHTYKTILRHVKSHEKTMEDFKLGMKERLESKFRKATNPSRLSSGGVQIQSLQRYCCPPCQATFSSSGSLLKHARKNHNLAGELKGDSELQSFSNQANKYGECRICKRMMINTIDNLALHLQQKHQISVGLYLKKYGGSNQRNKGTEAQAAGSSGRGREPAENQYDPIFISCDSATEDENPPSPIVEEGAANGGANNRVDSELETSSDEDEDDVDPVGIDSICADNLPEENARGNWHSKCTYQCHICKTYETPKLDILRHHLKGKHQVSLSSCDKDKMRIQEVYAKCGGCGINVLHDYYAIREHRDKKHPDYAPGQLSNFQAVFLGTRNNSA